MQETSKKYNLQDRTLIFGKQIIRLCKSIKFNPVTSRIIDQLVRAGTSIGANYMEAVNASSKKEAQETRYWLTILKECDFKNQEIDKLAQECHELNLIFQKSINTLNNNLKLDH